MTVGCFLFEGYQFLLLRNCLLLRIFTKKWEISQKFHSNFFWAHQILAAILWLGYWLSLNKTTVLFRVFDSMITFSFVNWGWLKFFQDIGSFYDHFNKFLFGNPNKNTWIYTWIFLKIFFLKTLQPQEPQNLLLGFIIDSYKVFIWNGLFFKF